MNNTVTATIQKTDLLTCDDWVIELPLFNLEAPFVPRWSANSLYVLHLNLGIEPYEVIFELNELEQINRLWDTCISNNLNSVDLMLDNYEN